ncbi:probable helicase senataxin isoform X5 [Ostrea edulis]|uniref:probable helicase senataxin isoform X5 n=1 Tax=Ostrea edulis TaxID=37623 RepID=UPI0024AFF82F|nr:probable helicase senataxin isoform X5 [Ostrea edulis]
MDIDEFSSDSSSCTVLEINEEEETWNNDSDAEGGKRKSKKVSSRVKRELQSNSDTSDKEWKEGRSKKKKLKTKHKKNTAAFGRKRSDNKTSKGKSGKTSTVSSTRANNNIEAYGFESEAIFSQVVKNKNDSSQETIRLTDDEDTQNGEKYNVKVPSFHFNISDEEMDADDEGLPSLVNPQRRCTTNSSTSTDRKLQGENGSLHSAMGKRKFSTQDIEDKEYWSDLEVSSSDDDTPLLQLDPANLSVSKNESVSLEQKGNIEDTGLTDDGKTSKPLFTIQKRFSSLFKSYSPMKKPKQCGIDNNSLSKDDRVNSDSNLIKNPGDDFDRNEKNVESDDETQPFDDDSLPDLSPQPRFDQSTKRESSPEIFEEESSDETTEVLYTQMDNCIYIEDSEEEELSQSLFQEEVKLELDDSSEEEVFVLDGSDEESWREILGLDDSDDGGSMKNEGIELHKPEQGKDSAYQMSTQQDTDLFTKATQRDDKDPCTGAAQIDEKNLYKCATQADHQDKHSSESEDCDIYNSTTQLDGNDGNISRNRKSTERGKFYASSTQVDEGLSSCEESAGKMETGLREIDSYSHATQVDDSSLTKIARRKEMVNLQAEDPYLCATQTDKDFTESEMQADVESLLSVTQIDEKDLYLTETQMNDQFCSRSSTKIRTLREADHANYKNDSFDEPTQKERIQFYPYDMATQADSSHHVTEMENDDSETDDVVLLTDTESQDSDESLLGVNENVVLKKTDTRSSKLCEKKKINSKFSERQHTPDVYELATQKMDNEGCEYDESKTQKARSKVPDDNRMERKKGGARNVVENFYLMETQVPDQSTNIQKEEGQSSDSWSDMELYEADTQIDLLSETQGATAAKASCVSETASEMTSSKPSTSSSLHTPSSHMISSTSSPPQQIRLPDGRSRNQEVFSDDMTDGKTRVYTDEEHQRTGASLLKESEVWSIEGRSNDVKMGRSSDVEMGRSSDAEMGRSSDTGMGKSSDVEMGRSGDAGIGRSNDNGMGRSNDVGTFAKKIGQSDQSRSSYHPPMLKQGTPIRLRAAIPISPQRKISTKEKREMFKTNSFYSKKELNLGDSSKKVNEGHSNSTSAEISGANAAEKTGAKTIASEASGWLSKNSGKTRCRKRQQMASGKIQTKKRREEGKSTVNNDAVIHAKATMIARNMVKSILPEPVKKPSIDTTTSCTEDVKMPDFHEVVNKQLPLINTDYRQSQPHQTNQADSTTNSDVRGVHEEASRQTERQDNQKHEDKHLSSSSSSHLSSSSSSHQKSSSSSHQKSSTREIPSKTSQSRRFSNRSQSSNSIETDKQKSSDEKNSLKSSGSIGRDTARGPGSEKKSSTSRSNSVDKSSTSRSNLVDKSSSSGLITRGKDHEFKSCVQDGEKSSSKKHQSGSISNSDRDASKSSSTKHESSWRSSSKDKNGSNRSSSKDKDGSNRSSSKDKDGSVISISKDSSLKSSSKERDSSGKPKSEYNDIAGRAHSGEKGRLGSSTSTGKGRSGETRSKEKDNVKVLSSKEKDSSQRSSSKEKDSSQRSSSKDKDHSQRSSSKDKDSSQRSSSKDKDHPKRSNSKDKDHSKRSSSKDKDHPKRSSSKDKDHPKRSSSKDKDHSKRSSSKDKDHPKRSSSKDKDHPKRSSSKDKDSSQKSNSKEKDSSQRSSSKDKDHSIRSSSKEKDSVRRSTSNSKHGSTKSHSSYEKYSSKDKDTLRRTISEEMDTSNISKDGNNCGRNTLEFRNVDKNCKDNTSVSSTGNSKSNMADQGNSRTVPDSRESKENSSEKASTHSKTYPSTTALHTRGELLTTGGIVELLLSNGVSTPAELDNETPQGVGCLDQNEKEEEEEEEDVKPGKLAKAAAVEKLFSSQEVEGDESNVIIIDDEEEDEGGRMKSNLMTDALGIKSILNKKCRMFFAEKNDESARKGQRIKFRLTPDRTSLRTQKYINSLIHKNKTGPQPGQSRGPSPSSCQPVTDSRGCGTTVTQRRPSFTNQTRPVKQAAQSSMDSSCVTAHGGQARAGGREGSDRTSVRESDHCSQFFSHLLQWNPIWLQEAVRLREDHNCRKSYAPPPVSGKVFPIPEKFDSYKDYVDIFIPHLLQEAWEQSYQRWRTLKNMNSYPQIRAVYSGVEKNSANNEKCERYTWYSIVTKETYDAMRKNEHLGEKFIVIVKEYGHFLKSKEKRMKDHFYQPNHFDQIAYIEKIQLHSQRGKLQQTINTFKVLGNDQAAHQSNAVVLCITILSKRRPLFKHLLHEPSFIQPVVSLVTIVRQFHAVSCLPRSPLYQHILIPGQRDVFYENITESEKQSLKCYNNSQQLAICTALKMILQYPRSPKIGLLQGPPGTGKSFTVVGIVEKILQGRPNVRICLCAPSNNAVDLLIKRLDDHKKQKRNTGMTVNYFASALSIVRIGNTESAHKDVKKFSLSEIVQDEAVKRKIEKKKENIPSSVLANYYQLKKKMEDLREQIGRSQGRTQEVERLTADLRKLEKRVTDMEKDHFTQIQDVSLSKAEEFRIKQQILQAATIVCGTLSAFGQTYISDLLRQREREGRPVFDCVIVDEASQANELDCIIPLRYGVNKFILVGDPEQLSPTVTSSKTAQNLFGQSLFERFYRHFQSCKETDSPILMLDTQYRMHPEIAYWPSQYIYQGKLKTDSSLRKRCQQNSRLKPFVLFDIEDSHENLSQTTGSLNNPAEVKFIVQLTLVILKSTRPRDIGIIAPYKSQKHLLCTSLSQDFMADRKRMNVALTRAKSALYIVAHLNSLQEADADWKNLIEDARQRNLIHTVGCRRDFRNAATNILI